MLPAALGDLADRVHMSGLTCATKSTVQATLSSLQRELKKALESKGLTVQEAAVGADLGLGRRLRAGWGPT